MPDAPYQLYRAEQRRRRRWPYIVIAAVCVFLAVVGWQLYGVPRVSAVTPGPDAYVKDAVADRRPRHQGAVQAQGRGGHVRRRGRHRRDPARRRHPHHHRLRPVRTASTPSSSAASSSNVFRRDVRKDWHFTVDTSVPELKLEDSAGGGPRQHRPGDLQRRDRAVRHGHRRRRRHQGERPGRRVRQVRRQRRPAGRRVGGRHHDRGQGRQHARQEAERVRRRTAAGAQDHRPSTRRSRRPA